MPIWSYSNWSLYEECPYKFEALVIDKRVSQSSGPALERGERIHRKIAGRLLGQNDWPPEVPIVVRQNVERLCELAGKPVVEQSLAVNEKLEPTGFFDENVVFRGKVDAFWLFTNHEDGHVFAIDWKTGLSEAKKYQLELMLGLIAVHTTDVYKKFNARFVYLETSKYDKDPVISMSRDEAIDKLGAFIEQANSTFEKEPIVPKPGPYCRWCPVHDCEYNPNRVPKFGE